MTLNGAWPHHVPSNCFQQYKNVNSDSREVTERIPISLSVRKESSLQELNQTLPVTGNNVKYPHVFNRHVSSETSLGAGTDHEPRTACQVNNQTPCCKL
jgi:hypothetical protein